MINVDVPPPQPQDQEGTDELIKANIGEREDDVDAAIELMRQPYIKRTNHNDSQILNQSQKMFEKICKDRLLDSNQKGERRSRGWMVEWPESWSEEQLMAHLQKSPGFEKLRCVYASVANQLVYLVLYDAKTLKSVKQFGLAVYGQSLLKNYGNKQKGERLGTGFRIIYENSELQKQSMLRSRRKTNSKRERSTGEKEAEEEKESRSKDQVTRNKEEKWMNLVNEGKSVNWILNNEVKWEDPVEAKRFGQCAYFLHTLQSQQDLRRKMMKVDVFQREQPRMFGNSEEFLKEKYMEFAKKNSERGMDYLITHILNAEKKRRKHESALFLNKAVGNNGQAQIIVEEQENSNSMGKDLPIRKQVQEHGPSLPQGSPRDNGQAQIIVEDQEGSNSILRKQVQERGDSPSQGSPTKSQENLEESWSGGENEQAIDSEGGMQILAYKPGVRKGSDNTDDQGPSENQVRNNGGSKLSKLKSKPKQKQKKPGKLPKQKETESEMIANCCSFYQQREFLHNTLKPLPLFQRELAEFTKTLSPIGIQEVENAMNEGFNPVYYLNKFKTEGRDKMMKQIRSSLRKVTFVNKPALRLIQKFLMDKIQE